MDVVRRMKQPVLGVAVSLLLVVGCGIFETRDVEPPGSQGTPWKPPTFPVYVFDNLESGLKDLTGANYERSLADVFTFEAHPFDVAKLPAGTYDDWTKTLEVEVTQIILNDATEVEVTFADRKQIRDDANFADFLASYVLTVTFKRGETESFQGVAQFDMQRVGQDWQLIKWTDQEYVEGFTTWGYLRGLRKPIG